MFVSAAGLPQLPVIPAEAGIFHGQAQGMSTIVQAGLPTLHVIPAEAGI